MTEYGVVDVQDEGGLSVRTINPEERGGESPSPKFCSPLRSVRETIIVGDDK